MLARAGPRNGKFGHDREDAEEGGKQWMGRTSGLLDGTRGTTAGTSRDFQSVLGNGRWAARRRPRDDRWVIASEARTLERRRSRG